MEGQTGLYVFFKTVCDIYDLLPAENYKLPPEAEGLEAESPGEDPEQQLRPTILKPPSESSPTEPESDENDSNHLSAARTNTRRHIRSSPSTGSAVTTVIEADEDEADALSRGIGSMSIENIAPDEATPLPSAIPSEAKTLEMILDSKYDEPELPPSITQQKLPTSTSSTEPATSTVDTSVTGTADASAASHDEENNKEVAGQETKTAEEHDNSSAATTSDDTSASTEKPAEAKTTASDEEPAKQAEASHSSDSAEVATAAADDTASKSTDA